MGSMSPTADRLRGDRRVGVLAEFRARDHRRPLVEQVLQRTQDASLSLAPLAEQDEVVAGDQRPLQLRQNGVLEAENAWPDFFSFG
jgi:hypothetical protein